MSSIPKPLQVAFNKIFVEKTMGEAFSPDTVEAVSELTEKYPEIKNKLFREMVDGFYAGRHPEKKPVQMTLDECVKKKHHMTETAERNAKRFFDAFYNGQWFTTVEAAKTMGWSHTGVYHAMKRLEEMGFKFERAGANRSSKYRSV